MLARCRRPAIRRRRCPWMPQQRTVQSTIAKVRTTAKAKAAVRQISTPVRARTTARAKAAARCDESVGELRRCGHRDGSPRFCSRYGARSQGVLATKRGGSEMRHPSWHLLFMPPTSWVRSDHLKCRGAPAPAYGYGRVSTGCTPASAKMLRKPSTWGRSRWRGDAVNQKLEALDLVSASCKLSIVACFGESRVPTCSTAT